MKALLLSLAFASATLGFAWLALAMEAHWRQVRGDAALGPTRVRMLRVLGAVGVAASLVACLGADHASMAALVWLMILAAAAMVVAFTLSWRPRLLALAVPWVREAAAPAPLVR